MKLIEKFKIKIKERREKEIIKLEEKLVQINAEIKSADHIQKGKMLYNMHSHLSRIDKLKKLVRKEDE